MQLVVTSHSNCNECSVTMHVFKKAQTVLQASPRSLQSSVMSMPEFAFIMICSFDEHA